MEISNQNTVANSGVSVSKKVSTGPASKTASPETPVPVSIEKPSSNAGIMVSQLTQRLMSESPVDETRVARLTAQIQSGQYQIDDRRVADKMIAFDQAVKQPNDNA